MDSYRSLIVWQRAHAVAVKSLEATAVGYHPRARALFDQPPPGGRFHLSYLPQPTVAELRTLLDGTIRVLVGLLRRPMIDRGR